MEKEKESEPIPPSATIAQPVENKPKSRRWCCIVPVIIVIMAVAAIIVYQFIPQDYSKQAPARGYIYPAPSAEALNRQLTCQDFPIFKNNPTTYTPLCLNLYKATADDINSANTSGKYNFVLFYGQYSTFSMSLPMVLPEVENLGESFLRVAKFNDSITMPKMMDYYGLTDLNFIPKQFAPFPSISYQFADQGQIKELCGGYVAGCAHLSFETVVNVSFLQTTKNWGARVTKDDSSEVTYEYEWPSDCYAIETIEHETGHNFLVANPITISGMKTDGWLHAPSYFNENLTEVFTMNFANDICGAGTVKISSQKPDGSVGTTSGIIEYNATFPPALLHPTSFPKDNQCEQAIISSYSHYLMKGDFKTQFRNFTVAFRKAMIDNVWEAYNDDKLMARFMVKMLGNDATEKAFLNSHGCGI